MVYYCHSNTLLCTKSKTQNSNHCIVIITRRPLGVNSGYLCRLNWHSHSHPQKYVYRIQNGHRAYERWGSFAEILHDSRFFGVKNVFSLIKWLRTLKRKWWKFNNISVIKYTGHQYNLYCARTIYKVISNTNCFIIWKHMNY